MPSSTENISIVTVACLQDNYAYLIHNSETGETALVDAPEAAPIAKVLTDRGWTLSDILITHHHDDHIQAVDVLRGSARVIGHGKDAKRLPQLDLAVEDGDNFDVCGTRCHVFDVSGHTMGHIAFHMPDVHAAFTADSLMALGCGRLFEGTPEQMWDSLQKLRALPPETMIYSGHEYTGSNANFALTVEPTNEALISRAHQIADARAKGEATVPSRLDLELNTNPFLRADVPELQSAVGMAGQLPSKVFAHIRRLKDNF